MKDSIEVSFSFEESPVDFTVKDPTGLALHFIRNKDSTFFHSFRLIKMEDQILLKAILPGIQRLWAQAENQIEIRLKSINVGYPLQYNDVLTNHIEAFSSSGSWRTQDVTARTDVDYELVEDIMLSNSIYSLDDLLSNFEYQVRDIDIEKVGYVEPTRLVGLGFDESLTIPVPYMVWILLEETN